MMKRLGATLAAALLAAGCNADVGQADGVGTIAGRVTLGPIMPVCRVDVPCDGAYKDAKVEVKTKSGAVAARATSDANGDFRLDVAAGAYTVAVAVEGMLPRCGEVEAVVAQEQTVRVAIDCDSGIR